MDAIGADDNCCPDPLLFRTTLDEDALRGRFQSDCPWRDLCASKDGRRCKLFVKEGTVKHISRIFHLKGCPIREMNDHPVD